MAIDQHNLIFFKHKPLASLNQKRKPFILIVAATKKPSRLLPNEICNTNWLVQHGFCKLNEIVNQTRIEPWVECRLTRTFGNCNEHK